MKNIVTILALILVSSFFIQCDKEEDMFERFSPEILYKRLTVTGDAWEVSPDAKEVILGSEESEWIIRARVSAPNDLALIELSANGNVLKTITDFELNNKERHIEYALTGIQKSVIVSIKAKDKRGNETVRAFTVIKE